MPAGLGRCALVGATMSKLQSPRDMRNAKYYNRYVHQTGCLSIENHWNGIDDQPYADDQVESGRGHFVTKPCGIVRIASALVRPPPATQMRRSGTTHKTTSQQPRNRSVYAAAGFVIGYFQKCDATIMNVVQIKIAVVCTVKVLMAASRARS
jgi:hypothetical protein